MSDINAHDRRALGVAAETLRSLASDSLYSDAFRHRIMSSVDVVGPCVRMLLYRTADRLDAMAERLTPPDTPVARLARKRKVRAAAAAASRSR